MNKRQRKKQFKKREMFAISFVSSYKELKEVERTYHEYVINDKRRKDGNVSNF